MSVTETNEFSATVGTEIEYPGATNSYSFTNTQSTAIYHETNSVLEHGFSSTCEA